VWHGHVQVAAWTVCWVHSSEHMPSRKLPEHSGDAVE
jgi:hypothetical protein